MMENAHKAVDANAQPVGVHDDALTRNLPAVKPRTVLISVAALVTILVALFLLGFTHERSRAASARAQAQLAKHAAPVVNVVRPARQSKTTDLVLPGNA